MRTILGIAAAAVIASSVTANAVPTFQGTFWDAPANTLATINDAIAFAGANAPTATFQSTSINYGDGPGWAIGSLSDFLNADAGSIVGTNPASIQESVFRLTGFSQLTNGQSISVTSDDGFRLFVDGNLFSEFTGIRAPNQTTSLTWLGATGAYSIELWYFEGQFTQAQLVSNLAPVPVPAAAALLLTALGGLGMVARRRSATATA
jgi:hypothetical protein